MECKKFAKQFAATLREIMKSKGVSRRWLADAAGTNESTISRYLKGSNQPEISIVSRVAKALGVSVDHLCGLTNLAAPKESMPAELRVLLRCYERADARDRGLVWAVLGRHMTDAERESGLVPGAAGT